MLKILLPILILAGLVGLVVSLDDERPRADVVLVHATDLFTLDPQKMSYLHDLRASRAIYETLATIRPDGSVGPAAAESWEISEDGTTYVFHLRDGLKFSNGDPVTAEDFKYAWRRAILPDTAATYSSLFMDIAGAEAFFKWRSNLLSLRTDPERRDDMVASGAFSAAEADAILAEDEKASHQRTLDRFDSMVGITATDDRTLVVDLERPLLYFLDLAAFGTFSPVHRPTLEGGDHASSPGHRPDRGGPLGWTKPGRLDGQRSLRARLGGAIQRDCRFEQNPSLLERRQSIPAESIEAVVIEDREHRDSWRSRPARPTGFPDVRAEYPGGHDRRATRLRGHGIGRRSLAANEAGAELDRTAGTRFRPSEPRENAGTSTPWTPSAPTSSM